MTVQVTQGNPVTVTPVSQVGGPIPNAAVSVDGGPVFKDAALSEEHVDITLDGGGSFTFYAPPGVYTIRVDDPIALPLEPVQVVGTGDRPGGVAAVHPDQTPAEHENSPVSQAVTDSSLVGAPGPALPEEDGGALAAVRVPDNTVIEPGPVSDVPTPDGTTATDPSAAAVPPESNVVTPDGQTVAAADYQAPDQPAEPQQ